MLLIWHTFLIWQVIPRGTRGFSRSEIPCLSLVERHSMMKGGCRKAVAAGNAETTLKLEHSEVGNGEQASQAKPLGNTCKMHIGLLPDLKI